MAVCEASVEAQQLEGRKQRQGSSKAICFPNQNPIENVWRLLKIKIARKKIRTLAGSKSCLVKEWNALTRELATKLVRSIERRVEALIEANGDYTMNKEVVGGYYCNDGTFDICCAETNIEKIESNYCYNELGIVTDTLLDVGVKTDTRKDILGLLSNIEYDNSSTKDFVEGYNDMTNNKGQYGIIDYTMRIMKRRPVKFGHMMQILNFNSGGRIEARSGKEINGKEEGVR
ncbi:hypothetical protein C2G38_2216777 [Gigaspora rosea]|uniref:Tc1-like transposase DDE domain-containing protein n=1 Tax=Gigaspora rosea TaxID=44941 RepID=A0A397UGV6_9GLOM|nr:hypothetical protein C2G38_2216777 [Gigaspora rosea]